MKSDSQQFDADIAKLSFKHPAILCKTKQDSTKRTQPTPKILLDV